MAITMDEFIKKNKGVTHVKDLSDGYHTYDDLYNHRKMLTALFVSTFPEYCWKSKKHNHLDDKIFDDMFIVGIDLPTGTITYHYDLTDFDLFHCEELPEAPKWDGASADDTLDRINEMILYYSKM